MKRKLTFSGFFLVFSFVCTSAFAQIQLVNPTVTDADNMLNVTLSSTDKNGVQLDESNLFFCVYKDNSDAPITFDKSTFAYIDAEMTEIPYGYSDSQFYDIWSDGGKTTIYHPSSWDGFEILGAQAVYYDGDVTYKSEIVWNNGFVGEVSGDVADTDEDGNTDSQEFDESSIISNPAGKKVETVRTSNVLYRLGGSSIYSGKDTGAMGNYVIGDDGNLYLLCVTGGNSTKNYLKLEPAGDNKYVAKMPQLVMIEEYDGIKYGYYACRMVKEYIDENPDSISYLFSTSEPNEIDFTLSEDGTLVMENEGENMILGLTYSDGSWTGYGDYELSDSIVATKRNVVPEDAVINKWTFEYQWANWPEYGKMKKFLDVAVCGNEIYINNPEKPEPDQWIKGVIEGDKAIFYTRQLLGADADSARYLYFRVGKMNMEITGYYSYADADKLVFNYDAETQTLTTDDLVSMYICKGYGQRGYNYNYDFPQLAMYSEKISEMKDPSFTLFSEDDVYDNYGYSYIQVEIPSIDKDGNDLNTDNLYYSIYVGDSNTPFVFKADTYIYDFTTDVTEIPFTHEGYDIYSYSAGSDLRNIFFYFPISDVRFGVQSIYYSADGNVHKSNIVYNTTTGIDEVKVDEDNDAPVYNLNGQIVNPNTMGKGIYIKNGKKFIKR